jgi:hypothetical protein
MKRIGFNKQFVNETGTDLIAGKIHTVRKNYGWWKRFEGHEVALFFWEDKPYRSPQKVFCIKQLVSVQEVYMQKNWNGNAIEFLLETPFGTDEILDNGELSKNDGFHTPELFGNWFDKYPDGYMAVLHFTDFQY